MVQGVSGEIAHQPFLGLVQGCGPEPFAVAAHGDGLGTPAFGQYECRQHPGPGADIDRVLHTPPVERRAVAQYGVDMAGDLRAVFGADIAPAPEIIGRDLFGRVLAGVNRSKNVDRDGDLRARCPL